MEFLETLPKLVEAPVIGLLAIVVVALAWTLTRVLAFIPRLPNAIVEAMSQAGEQSNAAFQQTVDELRERLDEANAEIAGMKRQLEAVDHDRRKALAERDQWQNKANELEAKVHTLETQVDELSQQVKDLDGRMAA